MSPGEQLSDYTHVRDVATALQLASEDLINTEPCWKDFLISSNGPKELRIAVSEICEELGIKPEIAWGQLPYGEREVFDIKIYDRFANLADRLKPKSSLK